MAFAVQTEHQQPLVDVELAENEVRVDVSLHLILSCSGEGQCTFTDALKYRKCCIWGGKFNAVGWLPGRFGAACATGHSAAEKTFFANCFRAQTWLAKPIQQKGLDTAIDAGFHLDKMFHALCRGPNGRSRAERPLRIAKGIYCNI